MINQKFAVVDLETTGNNKNKDSIIQLSIVFINNRQIVDQYSTFLSDNTDLSVFIQELTNIDESMLKGAPAFKDLAPDIYEKLQNHVFVAHNVDLDRKSTRLNSSHVAISYAVFCLKKIIHKE